MALRKSADGGDAFILCATPSTRTRYMVDRYDLFLFIYLLILLLLLQLSHFLFYGFISEFVTRDGCR